ncbi:MAG: DUF1269 domain-containing protein [Anaerolineales bacterium]|nr:DUF1269 domain-containing protein [Anaerolineales bacterium]
MKETLSKLERADYIGLDDSVVIVKNEEGEVHVVDEVDRGVKVGAVGGSFVGLLIAGFLFPIAGLVLGGLAGAALGKMAHTGIDKNFKEEVTEALEPGHSALFLMLREGSDADFAVSALKLYKGKVYQTSLSKEAEEELERVLKYRME